MDDPGASPGPRTNLSSFNDDVEMTTMGFIMFSVLLGIIVGTFMWIAMGEEE